MKTDETSLDFDFAYMLYMCENANRVIYEITGERDQCIAASAGLCDALIELGNVARVLRVEAVVHTPYDAPHDLYGCMLGSDGYGSFRLAAEPGKWRGHLVVIADEQFLLDPTLDQVNDVSPWLRAAPFVSLVSKAFLEGKETFLAQTGPVGSSVRYRAFPGRGGYKNTGAFGKRIRAEIAYAILDNMMTMIDENTVDDIENIA